MAKANYTKEAQKLVDFYKTPKGKKAVKALSGIRKELKSAMKEYSPKNQKGYKTATKVAAKKTVGRALGRAIPYAGAVIAARDVLKGVSKLTCGKRGGKWVSGKCVGSKKVKPPTNRTEVKDPISKR